MITNLTMLVNFKLVVYHPTYYGAPCRQREPSFILIGMSNVFKRWRECEVVAGVPVESEVVG